MPSYLLKRVVLLFLTTACVWPAFSQGMVGTRLFSAEDGLSQYNINAIAQDGEGFLWMATRNGLERYDGYKFQHFKSYPESPVRIGNHHFVRIVPSDGHLIWCIAYDSRCYYFDTRTLEYGDLRRCNELFGHQVRMVFPLPGGITWLQGEDVFYRVDENLLPRPEALRIYKDRELYGSVISKVHLDGEGKEWLLTDRYTLCLSRDRVGRFDPFEYLAQQGGRIYLANSQGYLARYDADSRTLSPCVSETPLNHVTGLFPMSDGRLAVLRTEGVSLLDANGEFEHHRIHLSAAPECHQDRQGRLWLLRGNGNVVLFDPRSGQHRNIDYPKIENTPFTYRLRFFIEDDCGGIWIKPRDGEFSRYNPEEERLEQVCLYEQGVWNPLKIRTMSYLIDRQHNLWFNEGNGLRELCFGHRIVNFITPEMPAAARALEEDSHGRLWVGWKYEGSAREGFVSLYDSAGRQLGFLQSDGQIAEDRQSLFSPDVYAIREDSRQRLWLGSKHDGLYVLIPQSSGQYRMLHYTKSDAIDFPLPSNAIYDILEDSRGRIWLGTYGGGLVLVDGEDGLEHLRFYSFENRLNSYPAYSCQEIRCLAETREGLLLVGTTRGLLVFDADFDRPETIRFYHHISTEDGSSLINNDIFNIYQTQDGRVYFSSMSGGLSYADGDQLLDASVIFRHYHERNSDASDQSLSLTEDSSGGLWLASENKVTLLDANWRLRDEIEHLRMTEVRPERLSDGRLAFGTRSEVLLANPGGFSIEEYRPNIVFIQARVLHQDSTEVRPLYRGQTLRLGKKERNCQIVFSAMDFSVQRKIEYAWRLRGVTDQWIALGSDHYANLVNLPPGRRLFEVRSTNADGQWTDNVTTLSLVVSPRFTETFWFYLLLFLFLGTLSWVVISNVVRLGMLRRKMDADRQLNEVKMRFFTEVSHELRTPLTLIEAPVEEMLRTESLSDKARGHLGMVRDNARRMLGLVNQILETRKMQDSPQRLSLHREDVLPLLRRVYESFRPMAEKQRTDYRFVCPLKQCRIYTDATALEKIVLNLLSNAFKYTPPGRSISLSVDMDREVLCLGVQDEGRGISEKNLARLFRPFETLDEADPSVSTGLGLAMVKNLVERLHGQVKVSSELGKGSLFSVRLPGSLSAFAHDDGVEIVMRDETPQPVVAPQTPAASPKWLKDRPTILLVEDNEELRRFMAGLLAEDYRVLEAENGRVGLEQTRLQGPDLVVSDIMMPEMDGIAYLKAIREDRELSHIPVLLLSARASVQQQIEGLEFGADDYLTKPFSASLLKAKIQTVFARRRALYEYMSGRLEQASSPSIPLSAAAEPAGTVLPAFDREFLESLLGMVEENLQNPQFKIEDLASGFNMSRSVFYRKLKSLTAVSPVDFVNRRRIDRACRLMEEGRGNFSEIAFECGFSSPQYFTRVFKKEKDCTPSQYRRQHFGLHGSDNVTK